MNELERYKAAIEHVKTNAMLIPAADLLRAMNTLLSPPTVYEEVEISRWECDMCGHVHKSLEAPAICNGVIGDGWCNGKDCFTLLTGTRKAAKPQPRERSVSVEAHIVCHGHATNGVHGDVFHDHPETHGKRGLLTFTWQE